MFSQTWSKLQIIEALPLHYRILVGKMLDSFSILVGLLDAFNKASKKMIMLTHLFADWWNCSAFRETFTKKRDLVRKCMEMQ